MWSGFYSSLCTYVFVCLRLLSAHNLIFVDFFLLFAVCEDHKHIYICLSYVEILSGRSTIWALIYYSQRQPYLHTLKHTGEWWYILWQSIDGMVNIYILSWQWTDSDLCNLPGHRACLCVRSRWYISGCGMVAVQHSLTISQVGNINGQSLPRKLAIVFFYPCSVRLLSSAICRHCGFVGFQIFRWDFPFDREQITF